MENPIVSVIVPVYNVEKYLRKCVDSILQQTYRELEVILVDDGSTDGSPLICDEYLSNDKRVKTLHKKNGGASSARNIGLSAMSGDYVTFIDSDDYLELDAIEQMMRVIQENDVDVCMMYANIVDEAYAPIRSCSDNSLSTAVFDAGMFLREMCLGCLSDSVCDKVFSKKTIANIRFKEGVANEDFLFMSELLINNKIQIVALKYNGYNYYMRSGSVSRNASNSALMASIRNPYNMMMVCIENNLPFVTDFATYAIKQLRAMCILLPYNEVFCRSSRYCESIKILKSCLQYAPPKVLSPLNMLFLKACSVMPMITLPLAHTIYKIKNTK